MGKRYDKKHRLLKTGETERADGYYTYRGHPEMGNGIVLQQVHWKDSGRKKKKYREIHQMESGWIRRMLLLMMYLSYGKALKED